MSGISIEIEYPGEAHMLLSNDIIASSASAYMFKKDLIKKIERGILQKEYCNVWRQIEAFPGYEINGNGIIRHLGSHESIVVTIMHDEPIMVALDDIHGVTRAVLFESVLNDTFPELKG